MVVGSGPPAAGALHRGAGGAATIDGSSAADDGATEAGVDAAVSVATSGAFTFTLRGFAGAFAFRIGASPPAAEGAPV
jgi:hypothetical protein